MSTHYHGLHALTSERDVCCTALTVTRRLCEALSKNTGHVVEEVDCAEWRVEGGAPAHRLLARQQVGAGLLQEHVIVALVGAVRVMVVTQVTKAVHCIVIDHSCSESTYTCTNM